MGIRRIRKEVVITSYYPNIRVEGLRKALEESVCAPRFELGISLNAKQEYDIDKPSRD
jgi:hypothetical protein